MSRSSAFAKSVVANRWSQWLSATMRLADVSSNALATELLRRRVGDDIRGRSDLKARRNVNAWLSGQSPPTARSVYASGEALRELGVVWASGPVALFAAGYLGDFLKTMARLCAQGADLEVARFVYASSAAEATFEKFTGSVVNAKWRAVLRSDGVPLPNAGGRYVRASQRLMAHAIEQLRHAAIVAPANFDDANIPSRGTPPAFRLALAIADQSTGVRFHLVEESALTIIDRLWARDHANRDVRRVADQFRYGTLIAEPEEILQALGGRSA